ncbi:MAG TPA: multidrug effflux MFS transporter [Aestuariivirga sp.]|nr:multidrug effflux MFS transporter [Aestuariivirga sp.]
MTASKKPSVEFIILVALLSAMVAMSIDAMLPAVGQIASELGAHAPNDRQLIITMFFAGLTVGTLIYGPISDSTGRKPAIFAGLALYAAGSFMCLFATSFTIMLVGRTLQGFGAAGPRIVSIAMVRDGSAGAAMARVMSFVMAVFMLVPILAPAIGQAVLFVASWRMIFAGFLAMALIATLWVALRQLETLPRSRRSRLDAAHLLKAAKEFLSNPVAVGYTLAVGAIFGSFICYLGTSQQIFAEQYGQAEFFALWFGLFAVAIAIAMVLNGRLVMRYGMRNLSKWALRASIVLSLLFLAVAVVSHGHPPLWSLGLYLFCNFFCSGILFGNYNALAMEPMGHIAGMAAAISGSLSSLVALGTGTWIGLQYNGTVIPLAAGFAGLGIVAFLLTEWAERRRT